MSEATDATSPEERHPRLPEFEGAACEVRHDGTRRPGMVRAVYQPAPDQYPDAKRVVVETEAGVVDTNPDRDGFEVLLS